MAQQTLKTVGRDCFTMAAGIAAGAPTIAVLVSLFTGI